MGLKFSWDVVKARQNERKHRVSFREATTVFGDAFSVLEDDPDHSDSEERWLLLGLSERDRLLVVVFADRGDIIRIISARRADAHERNDYQSSRRI